MFSIVYAIKIGKKVIECQVANKFASMQEAISEAEQNKMAIAYRVFDKSGFRVASRILA